MTNCEHVNNLIAKYLIELEAPFTHDMVDVF